MTSFPPLPATTSRIEDFDDGRQALDADRVVETAHGDRVGRLTAVETHNILLIVTRIAALRDFQVDIDLDDFGAREVADDDRVGPAKRVIIDQLDAIHVHRDRGHVAKQKRPRAIG